MSENYKIALELLIVGMIAVGVILWLVVLVGNALILLVNRFAPEAEVLAKGGNMKTGMADASKMAAIEAAVKLVTQGRGHVEKIEKK